MTESHVVSLELSKKLKEIGYPQEGAFFWKEDLGIPSLVENKSYLCSALLGIRYYVAPLASELMERLPNFRKDYSIEYTFWKMGNYWMITFQNTSDLPIHTEQDSIFCNALAKMIIFLHEKGLVKWTV
jgi:hypothetical protein